MPNKLVGLKVSEVSGVDKAANMRKFLIVKNATPGTGLKDKLMNIVKSYLPPKGDNALTFTQAYAYEVLEDQLCSMMYDAGYALRQSIQSVMKDPLIVDKIGAINSNLAEFSDAISTTLTAALAAVENGTFVITKREEGTKMPIPEDVMKSLPEEVRNELASLEKRAADAEALVVTLKKGAEPPVEDPILKGASPEMLQLIAGLQKKADDAVAMVKAEQEARLNKEYIAKAAEFSHLGINAEELGPVLKSLHETSPEQYEKMVTTLKSAEAMMLKSDLLKEFGASGGTGTAGDAWTTIQKRAEEIRKVDVSMTQEQALAKVMRDDPKLYQDYLTEAKA